MTYLVLMMNLFGLERLSGILFTLMEHAVLTTQLETMLGLSTRRMILSHFIKLLRYCPISYRSIYLIDLRKGPFDWTVFVILIRVVIWLVPDGTVTTLITACTYIVESRKSRPIPITLDGLPILSLYAHKQG